MRLEKPHPLEHVRVTITRQEDHTETFSVYEVTQEEFVKHVEKRLKGHINLFAKGRTLTISIRRCAHWGDGSSVSLSFKGLSPKQVRDIVLEGIV